MCDLLHKALSILAAFVEDWISHRLVLCWERVPKVQGLQERKKVLQGLSKQLRCN